VTKKKRAVVAKITMPHVGIWYSSTSSGWERTASKPRRARWLRTACIFADVEQKSGGRQRQNGFVEVVEVVESRVEYSYLDERWTPGGRGTDLMGLRGWRRQPTLMSALVLRLR
jgi:hypothetical protein